MKLLVYEWTSFTNPDLYLALEKDGISFQIARIPFSARNPKEQDAFKTKLEELMKAESYDAVFSIDFFDCIAEVCHQMDTMYIAWTYDSPAMGGRVASHYLSTNRLFLFDSVELERHQKMGKEHMHFLNLAVNTERLNTIVTQTPMEQWKYQCDISFVGQLYETQMQELLSCLDPYRASYLNALVDIQMRHYDMNFLKPLVTQGLLDFISNPEFTEKLKPFSETIGLYGETIHPSALEFFLLRRVTNRERVLLLALLSKYHQVKLFSGDKHQVLEHLLFCGKVDYFKEMPKVFKNSKINLNITLRTIEAGIPQRCLDIMGCHAFLLTNYQKDLFTELEEDKDLVIYRSIEEAVEKANFYLKHETLRKKIADQGYKKVKDRFSYHRQLEKIWSITGLK